MKVLAREKWKTMCVKCVGTAKASFVPEHGILSRMKKNERVCARPSICLLLLTMATTAFSFHAGLSQDGFEVGKRWENGMEANLFSDFSYRFNDKPNYTELGTSIGMEGLYRIFGAFSTEFKIGPGFNYRRIEFDGLDPSEDVFIEVVLLGSEIEYRANENISTIMNTAEISMRFVDKFNYYGMYLGGLRPRIGIRAYF